MTRLALLLLVLLAIVVPAASAIPPGPARIKVTLQTVSQRYTNDGLYVTVFRIYNRPAYRRSIGISILICRQVYPTVKECRQNFRLHRGQIIGSGLVTNLDFYRLAVIGGIGYYDNIGGSTIQQRIGSDAYAAVLNLTGI